MMYDMISNRAPGVDSCAADVTLTAALEGQKL